MQDFLDAFGGMSQHWPKRDARSEVAVLVEGRDAMADEGRKEGLIVRVLTEGRG